MGWWKDFVSTVTGESTSKVSKAGHDFRDHSGAREGKDSFGKAPKWVPPTTDSGVSYSPKGKGSKD